MSKELNKPINREQEGIPLEETDRTHITDEVFAEIARSAMQKVNEVARQEKKGALAELTQLFSERIAPQIVVKRVETDTPMPAIVFEIKLALIYGARIPDVVAKVRDAIKTEVETLTGCRIDHIDILVEKLLRSEPAPEVSLADKGPDASP